MSTRARPVASGDRAYFKTWARPGRARRLEDTDWVQVAPCSGLGLCRFGPQLDAAPRLLDGEEASQAARKLASKRPARRDRLGSLAYRSGEGSPLLGAVLAPTDAAAVFSVLRKLPMPGGATGAGAGHRGNGARAAGSWRGRHRR